MSSPLGQWAVQYLHAVQGRTFFSSLFLFHKIGVDSVSLIQIGIYVHLADIVEQIEIEVFHLAFSQLFFKNGLNLVHVGKVIAGELCGQIEIFPGIGF